MKKRILAFGVVLSLLCGLIILPTNVSAVQINKGKIQIDTVEGVTGGDVVVPIRIIENPGIMAVTVSVTYDPNVLKYDGFYYGGVFNDYTIADHPSRKLIRVVICDTRDKTKDGKIISFKFKIAEDAKAELTKIDMQYSSGDICNWYLDKIMPEVVSGGVNVAFNGKNCTHKGLYGDWTVVSEPVCKEVGVKERVCSQCGAKDYAEIEPIGHTYSDTWTVDKPATAESDGTMSRYCIRCDDYVDRITFSLEDSEKENIDNTIWEDLDDKETGEELFKEQNPGKKPTVNSNTESTKDSNESGKDSSTDKSESAVSNDTSTQNSAGTESGDQSSETESDSSPDADEKDKNVIKDVMESVLPQIETDDGETKSLLEILTAEFPFLEKTFEVSEILVIILIILAIF